MRGASSDNPLRYHAHMDTAVTPAVHEADSAGLTAAARALADGPGWHFAGRDPHVYARVRDALGATGPEISGCPLGEVVDELRCDYLELLGEVPTGPDDVAWFESTAAEKQFGESCVMREAALAVRAAGLLADNPGLVVVAENARVAAHLRGDAVPVTPQAKPSLRSVATFTAAHLDRARRSRAALPGALAQAREAGPLTVLVAWLDARSMGDDGTYRDPYFGDLVERARADGHAIAVVPVLVPGTDLDAALRFMAASEVTFLPPHLLVTLADIRAAWRPTPPRAFRDAGALGGVALEPLLSADAAHDVAARSVWFNRLVAAVPGHLRTAGVDVARVIMPFENLNWEKRLLVAWRRSFPDAPVVGYQHSTLTHRKLRYFASAREASLSPLPDSIVTNSDTAHRLLAPVFGDRLTPGGALRYADLASCERFTAPETPCVVAALSLELSEAAESLAALVEAFADGEVPVIVKPHPVADSDALLAAAGARPLPSGFELLDARTPAPLERASVLVATSSTIVLEAIARDVPVVTLELARAVNESPLLEARDACAWAYGAEELQARVGDAIAQGQTLRDEMHPVWSATVSAMVSPAGSETYRALLG